MKYITYKEGEAIKKQFELDCEVLIKNNSTVSVEESAIIDVTERLIFHGDALIRDCTRIIGRDIEVGHKFYMNHHAEIGGGSCKGPESLLRIGNHFHLGSYSMINTAREVIIGDEVGFGRLSNIYTHGAYLNVLEGFPEQWAPVKIGNNVWCPNATIMPGVIIGDNTVVAASSMVNKNIAGGGLWAGIPARKIEGVVYPNPMSQEDRKKYLSDLNANDPEELRRHGIRKTISFDASYKVAKNPDDPDP